MKGILPTSRYAPRYGDSWFESIRASAMGQGGVTWPKYEGGEYSGDEWGGEGGGWQPGLFPFLSLYFLIFF